MNSCSLGGRLDIAEKLDADDDAPWTRLTPALLILLLKIFSIIVEARVPPRETARFIIETMAAIWRRK